ncbi:MAG: glycosyltransferase family 4 protein, partial [Flavisolibacter sp.]
DAVKKIYFQIEPLLRQKLSAFKILICGRNKFPAFAYLKELKNDNIIQAGFVENVAPYFAGADVFINPVQNVHGVQTKLFDALNYNLNMICFKAAAKELPSYLDDKIFVSDNNDFDSFADNIVQSLKHNFDTPEKFYTDYSWSNIVKKFAMYLKQNHSVN